MTTSSHHIPHEWQLRLRKIPAIDRMAVTVYLISRYKQISSVHTPWKKDAPLSHLAFWPRHIRYTLLNIHTNLIHTDPQYELMYKQFSLGRASIHTNGATQNVNTKPCNKHNYNLGA